MKNLITNLVGTGTVAAVLQYANTDPILSGIVNMGLAIGSGSLITFEAQGNT